MKRAGKLRVLDLPLSKLHEDVDNPNEMDEDTLDLLIDEIREQGFDEPILVRRHPSIKGHYQIGSGHHRVKAARALGMDTVPAVIKEWTDREQKTALVKRNALRGELSAEKMVKLYSKLAKGRDATQVQRELGFTSAKKLDGLIGEAAKALNPKQRKKLADAKETIKSVDDLSSVLNRIFKESGSELDKGYMVFSFGGKNHHYFQITDETDSKLKSLLAACDATDTVYTDFIEGLIESAVEPKKRRVKRRKK